MDKHTFNTPPCNWSQTRTAIIFTIIINTDINPVHIKYVCDTDSFKFSYLNYNLDLKLYDEIIPNECDYKLCQNKIIFKFTKKNVRVWKFLLQTYNVKDKLWLTIDWSHYIGDSDSDISDDNRSNVIAATDDQNNMNNLQTTLESSDDDILDNENSIDAHTDKISEMINTDIINTENIDT
jgi:hypothetical protein